MKHFKPRLQYRANNGRPGGGISGLTMVAGNPHVKAGAWPSCHIARAMISSEPGREETFFFKVRMNYKLDHYFLI
jgi:hypothetical protein